MSIAVNSILTFVWLLLATSMARSLWRIARALEAPGDNLASGTDAPEEGGT